MSVARARPIASTRSGHAPERHASEIDDSVAVWTGAAFEAALRSRAPGVHASTPMVRQLAAKVARELGLDARSSALLDLAARVRDIGMIALPDGVVLATARLTPEQWTIVNRHPVIGALMLEEFPAASVAAPVVRSHHERWDGAGYPDGLKADAIPLLSRVIAVCDAFVAMARDRPHRRGIGTEVALGQLRKERGTQFDASIVDALISGLGQMASPRSSSPAARGKGRLQAVKRHVTHAGQGDDREDVLISAVQEFDVVPAFEPAVERALAALGTQGRSQGELVATIESDTGLTIAILRRAQAVSARVPLANVPDALAALTSAEIQAAIETLPRAEFPWRTSPIEIVLHQGRVHAQAVMRAADRIVRELGLARRDDVLVAALVHDVGKLVLARAYPEYSESFDVRRSTPEQRVRQEQRSPGLDHAAVGGLLMRRWGLPGQLVRTVDAHHRAQARN
ncbi:MAG: HD domain-containing phosphohydrolase, partial [Solirubrobacteraceae bacterium]